MIFSFHDLGHYHPDRTQDKDRSLTLWGLNNRENFPVRFSRMRTDCKAPKESETKAEQARIGSRQKQCQRLNQNLNAFQRLRLRSHLKAANCRAPKEGEAKAKASRFIVLIRHGHYHDDKQTDDERVLTSTGRQQARIVAQRLADMPWSAHK